jgi:hypothetical protein
MPIMAIAFLYAFYCFEAGAFFIVAPWTKFWLYNPLLHSGPLIASIADNFYLRGFVSGIGVVHILAGVVEVASIVRKWRTRTP